MSTAARALFACAIAGLAAAQEWKPAKGPLKTQWTDQVTPAPTSTI